MRAISIKMLIIAAISFKLLPNLYGQISNSTLQITIEEFTQKQGLPQGYVTSIVQDKTGFLWIGTKLGLSRYDGYKFVTFQHNPKNTNSISSNFVRSLLVDENNFLWVATNDGNIDVIDLAIMKFYHRKSPYKLALINNYFLENQNYGPPILRVNDSFYKCGLPKKGNIEFTNLKISLKMDAFSRFLFKPKVSVTGEFVYPIKVENGTDFYLYNVNNFTSKFLGQTTDKSVFVVNYLSKSNCIYYTNLTQHFLLNTKTKLNIKLSFDDLVNMFLIDKQENIWFHFKENLFIVKPNETEPKVEKLITPKAIDLKFMNFNNSSFEDKTGNIYIGLSGFGMFKIHKANGLFKKGVMDINNPAIYRFYTNNTETIFVHKGDGIIQFNSRNQVLSEQKCSLLSRKSNLIGLGNPVLVNDNLITFCTNNLVHEYNIVNKKEKLVSSILNLEGYTYVVFYIKNADKYLCLNLINNIFYLLIYDKNYQFQSKIKLSERTFSNLSISFYDCHLLNNNKIALVSNVGLFIIDLGTKIVEEINTQNFLTSENLISSYYDAINQILWLGTEGEGLLKYNLLTRKCQQFVQSHGLPDLVIYGILNYNNYLWLSTNNGLSCMNITNNTFVNYKLEDGLQDNEFNRFAYGKINDSIFVFGGLKGFNYFNPAQFFSNSYELNIGFSSIKINNAEILNNEKLKKNGNTYFYKANSDENSIQLDFSVFDFNNPLENNFKYRIVNKDSNWISLGNTHTLYFSSLKSGEYIIQVMGKNSRGFWVKAPILFHIIIATPWYKTWWAIIVYFTIAILMFYAIFRYRLNQIKRLFQLRTQISSDLHDDVGSSISSVNIYNRLLKLKLTDKQPELIPLIDKTDLILNDIMEDLSDIVWAINPKNDKLENVFTRIEQQVLSVVYDSGYKVIFEVDAISNKLNLSLNFRKNLYLCLKEAINNTLKFANGNTINIKATIKNKEFTIDYCDDGIGFDFSNTKMGNGVLNIQKRINELGGKCETNSQAGKGVSYKFTFPVANLRH